MFWGLAATGLLLAAPLTARALTQVSGPVQIGPSGGNGDAQNHSARLTTTISNHGQLPDRLVNVACPGFGAANLSNGQVQTVATPSGAAPRNGLDLPGEIDDRTIAVQVQINLVNATQPMLAGTLVPCALYFQHAGQRIVIFALSDHEPPADEP